MRRRRISCEIEKVAEMANAKEKEAARRLAAAEDEVLTPFRVSHASYTVLYELCQLADTPGFMRWKSCV